MEIEKLWKDFGDWVRQRRESLGLSQEVCADKIDMRRQQWYRIEQGIGGTKRQTLYKIAFALNVPAAVVLDRAGFKVPGSDADPMADRLLALLSELSAPAREDLFAIAEALWRRHGPSSDENERLKHLPEWPDLVSTNGEQLEYLAGDQRLESLSEPNEYLGADEDNAKLEKQDIRKAREHRKNDVGKQSRK